MRRSLAHLADGREILYFDERDDGARAERDRRDLVPVASRSEMRYDALLDEWVVMATHRQGRTHLPPTDQCPLCPSRGDRLTEIPAASYDVVVFENRFPSLAGVGGSAPPPVGLGARAPGAGRCEVVCFTSDHQSSFAALSPARARLVVEAWADRTAELGARPGVEQVFCFENRGEEIGVTLAHPHGQVYAYPYVTPRTARHLDAARRHAEATGRNLFGDVLARERLAGERVVASSRHWTAFVPVAARWPLEVHLYPHRQVPDLPALEDDEREDLARTYLDVLRRVDAVYDTPTPYVAGWHQAPVRQGRDLAWLHLELFSVRRAPGKLKYLAGSESGMGAFVNDVLPEEAAARLREAATPVG